MTSGGTSHRRSPAHGREAARSVLRAMGATMLLAGKAAALAFSVEPVLWPKQGKYKGKAMRIRALGYFGMLFAVPVAWLLRGHREDYPVLPDLALSVPLLLDAGGNSLGIYDDASIDDLVHFANTAILSSAFGAAVSPHVDSRWKAGALTIAFGVIGELGWEVMEYSADRLGYKGLSLSRQDTLADIGEGVLGALLAGAITTIRWKPRGQLAPAGADGGSPSL